MGIILFVKCDKIFTFGKDRRKSLTMEFLAREAKS